jgi:WD40 repeat protein
MNRRFEFVLPLTPDELERAVLSPAQRVGLKMEKGLVSTIVREVGNQPGALPLLQYALSELFEKREGRMLTNKAYQEIGGALGALGRSAETIYSDLDEDGQSAARQLFLRLVTLGEGTEDTRRRVLREEIESLHEEHQADIQTVIDTFGKARLLSFDRDPVTRGATIEVAHEALLREWTRLREWLTESRSDVRTQRQLSTAVREWNHGQRDSSFLMTGSRLEQFEDWFSHTTIALTQDERAFITASTQEEQARRRRELRAAKQLKQRAIYLSVALVLAIVLAGVALFFGNQANKNAAEANASEKIATGRELAAAAVSNLDVDPELSILLALQSEATVHTIEAENTLHRSILASRVVFVLHHDGIVYSVNYSPDGKRIATSSADKTAKIWDANTGELLLTMTGHTDEVWGLSYSPDSKRVATTSADKTAKVWDAYTGELLLTLTGHTAPVSSIEFSPDGTRIVTTSHDTTAKIWNAVTGKELLTFSAHTDMLYGSAFSPDGKRVATCGADGFVRVWDANSGKELLTLPVEGVLFLYGVAFSPDGTRLTTVGDGSYFARTWDTMTGAVLYSGRLGHSSAINKIVYSPDGRIAATGSDDSTAIIWDNVTGQVLTTLSGHARSVDYVSLSPDGARLVTASYDGTARVWNLMPTKEALFIPLASTETSRWSMYLGYSPDGTRILTDYADGDPRIWDTVSGKELLRLRGGHALYETAYSSDGKLAAAGNEDKTITVWDAQTGKERIKLAGHTEDVWQTAFSPDGTRLASTSSDGTVIVWDVVSGQALFTFQGFGDIAYVVAYSPDGKHLVAGGGTGAENLGYGVIWDINAQEKLFTLPVDTFLASAAYSPDGKLVALASYFGTVSIWDTSTGKQLLTLTGHTSSVNAEAFSPDGKLLATASQDGTVRLWNVTSGANPLTLYVDIGGVGGVSFSPDGKRLAVGGRSGVSIFYLQIEDVIALAKSRVTRALTLEECQQYLHVDTCPAVP